MRSGPQLRLLVLSVGLVTVSTLPAFLTGAAFFQIGPELGLETFDLGLLTAVFFLTASLTSPFLGRWVERVGWRTSMRVNIVTSSLVTVLVAPLARDGWTLGVLLVASGVVYGASNPAANQALARHTSPRRAGLVFGLKHAGIPSSTLLAGAAVPGVVVGLGWRAAFAAAALLGVGVWFLVPAGAEYAAPAGSLADRSRATFRARSGLRWLAVASALGAVAAVALGTFLVSASLEAGLTESGAGWLQFTGSAVSIAGRVTAGSVADRSGGLVWILTGLLASGAVVVAFLSIAVGWLFAAGVVAAYATGWGWPGLMTATVVGSDRSAAAASSSVTQAGVFLGAGGAPLLLGAVVARWSFGPMWLVVAGCLAGAAVLAGVAGRRLAPFAP